MAPDANKFVLLPLHNVGLFAVTEMTGEGLTVTFIADACEVPHGFPAMILSTPEFVPVLTEIVLVDEVPVQPPGKLQV